ncbi:hypothetical protein RFI_12021 [Reticulomyxa filosa]|uniref:Uncharacterized protein n=1 Tax=Reticulomyxa filosa TaxID=46433 RepID=X6NHA7_RETFI|nr:hypothetical protein RFI_12021 [Reticulomyxa filosa]|eukprot:ETO25124.1 hypothetical protein RFI_12021 [Reticulomyxa filosa]
MWRNLSNNPKILAIANRYGVNRNIVVLGFLCCALSPAALPVAAGHLAYKFVPLKHAYALFVCCSASIIICDHKLRRTWISEANAPKILQYASIFIFSLAVCGGLAVKIAEKNQWYEKFVDSFPDFVLKIIKLEIFMNVNFRLHFKCYDFYFVGLTNFTKKKVIVVSFWKSSCFYISAINITRSTKRNSNFFFFYANVRKILSVVFLNFFTILNFGTYITS